MKQRSILLGHCRWVTYDMHDGDIFRVGACNCVDGREFSDTKGCDKSRDAFDARIAIGSIS